MVEKRKGIKFAFAEPDPEKIIVSMLKWRGSIYVATQKGIYRVGEKDELVRLKIVDMGTEKVNLKGFVEFMKKKHNN